MDNIVICNFKGGVGKSLTAHQLITGFGYKGIEVDPYGSLADRLPNDVIHVGLKDQLPDLSDIDEKVIFDFGGFDDPKLEQAAALSGLIIVPFIATLESVQTTVETLHRIKGFNKPILFVANMTHKEQDAADSILAFQEVLGYDVEVFYLPMSVGLQTAINENKSILDLANQGGIAGFAYKKAADSMRALHNKILEYKE